MAHPDAKLLKLGAEFEFAVVNFHRDCAALDAIRGTLSPGEIDDRFEPIDDKMDAPRDAIAATRAKTLAGFHVKARAAAWPYADNDGTYFPAYDEKIIRSILADLLAITGPKVCIGAVPDGKGNIAPLFASGHDAIEQAGLGNAGIRRRQHADLSAQVVARDIVRLDRRPVPKWSPPSAGAE